jgi:flagellar biosynthesis anti-sigma factor FlgM
MKISNVFGAAQAYRVNSRPKASQAPDAGGRTGAADEVVLSKEAQDVLALKEKMVKLPDVRQQRVDELRDLVARGGYRPAARDVADKILGSGVLDDLL